MTIVNIVRARSGWVGIALATALTVGVVGTPIGAGATPVARGGSINRQSPAKTLVVRDPVFDAVNGLKMHIIEPVGAVDLPVILLVHGGAWVSGSDGAFGSKWAVTGLVVQMSPQYRLGAAGAYPSAETDVGDAIAWAKANATTYGGDPNRIAAVGSSVGGQLLAMNSSAVSAIATLSSPLDLTALETTGPSKNRPFMADVVIHQGTAYAADPDQYAADSPVDQQAFVPWLAFNGTRELMPSSQLAALAAADPAAETHLLTTGQHACETCIVPGDPLGRAVWLYVLDWLLARV